MNIEARAKEWLLDHNYNKSNPSFNKDLEDLIVILKLKIMEPRILSNYSRSPANLFNKSS